MTVGASADLEAGNPAASSGLPDRSRYRRGPRSVTEDAAADQLVDDVGLPPLHDCGGPLALIV